MDWDDLRYFLALARSHTVSAAGRSLGVKHTTVGRRVKALEHALSSRLFDHTGDGYALTQAGENLFQRALIIEEQTQAVKREVFGLDAQLSGTLNVTAAHDVANRLVIPYLAQFKTSYPELNLQLFSSAGLMDLAAREADIALRLTANPPDYLIGKKVLPLSHGLYASEKYLVNEPKSDSVVLWAGEEGKPDWVHQHFPNATVGMRSDDITSILSCLENHLGIGRLPCYIGDSSPELKRLHITLEPSDWGIWVLSHADLRTTARVRACRGFLTELILQQKALIEGAQSRYWQG